MTLEEAIEVNEHLKENLSYLLSHEGKEALHLGSEALKYLKDCREHDRVWMGDLLPGETEG